MTSYHKTFEKYLIEAKLGLIISLITLTVIYQIKYRSEKYANTFLSDSSDIKRIVIESILTGILGSFATLFVIFIRGGVEGVKYHWKTILLVGFILGLFDFVQESSGFNRYLDKNNIEQGDSVYNEFDGNTPEEIEKIKIIETGGDPFLNSLSIYSMILVGIIIFYYIWKMIETAYSGYKSGQHNINDIKYTHTLFSNPVVMFIFELLIVAILNGVAPIITPYIRKEKITKKSLIIPLAIIIICICLQIMLQYSGMLQF